MKIVDLSEKFEKSFFLCLEDWSDEIREAGNHKSIWYNNMKTKGLCVKLALNEKDEPAGMIQYLPIEHSFITGKDLYFILCVWVHGYKKGIGNYQKRGYGKALFIDDKQIRTGPPPSFDKIRKKILKKVKKLKF